MTAQPYNRYIKARASPLSDVGVSNANMATEDKCDSNARAYPRGDGDKNHRSQPALSNKLRLGTWNLGTMTGRSAELSQILHNRNINICCIQETKWKGSKSREIGHGFQLVYHGVDTKRNGVGIILDQNLKHRIVGVERKSDRLIAIKLAMDDQPILNIVSAYAPQVGCPALEKEAFWEDFDEECIHIRADLNGHVGASNEAFPNTHGGYGLGRRNREGLDILNFASRYNFKIVNTQFRKKEEHLITYKSAKLLVAVVNLPKPIRIRRDNTERIKWKVLHGDKGIQFINIIKSYLTEDLGRDKTTDKMWQDFEDVCHKQARLTLGVSKGEPPTAKDPTWWNDAIKQIIKAKREAFKLWQKSKLEDDRAEYKTLKVLAKSSVAQARAISRQDFYDRLENATNENQVFKVAKQRYRARLDTKFNKYIKDSHGKLLTSNDAINYRWKEYYEQLLNEWFPSENQITLPSIAGPLECIHPMEIKLAIRKMEHNKALGPDNVPVDIWKLLGEDALPWLTSFFNKIAFEGKIPASMLVDATITGIKLMSHTLKLWERSNWRRLTALTKPTANQFGFTTGRKAFDKVPRELVWQALRAQEIPEAYITLIQDMYDDVSTQIKSPAGISDPFYVRVGVHQGSTISPLLFNLTMDYITKNIQAEIPWCMLYADDIVLVAKKASELQNTFNTWLRELKRHGLRVSRIKTEFMECDFGGSEEIGCDILIDSTALPKVSRFKYLGSMLTTDIRT
ncbi:hypothetical protein MSG28_016031 [Choristoneura fumiferana]|uniref:Uncharacterized protein n=1 Tax=Choristoneura fumiferana TaxID=7141 RepID=A0ACC0K513_CHOFU|nr:hypothetical protein MSG28_016031 [Choristoneura fumiferana]